MDPKTASNLRKIALVGMIIADAAMLVFWALSGQIVTFWMFVGINLCVVAAEIVNNFWVYGKTVSTQITKTLESQEKMRPWIYAALICFGVSMAFLIAHWGIWS